MARLLWFNSLDLEVPADQLGQLGTVELRVKSGNYVLRWDDGVTNEWVETFTMPEHAFARVAALLHACRTNRVLRSDSIGFANPVRTFLDDVTES